MTFSARYGGAIFSTLVYRVTEFPGKIDEREVLEFAADADQVFGAS
ncbi:hypothetical protein [Kitasatospora terrestris]